LTACPRSTSLWYNAATVAPISGPTQKIHCTARVHICHVNSESSIRRLVAHEQMTQ
jgi:hypothetical protein